jgi:hypothetical protein
MIPATLHYVLLLRDNRQRDQVTEEEVLNKYSSEELSRMEEHSPLFRYST